ncbi:uncharacterized protein LOC141673226 [Apium graveolens]|uniref:uncharacterized protein LOC141673226 n=1 Tax=Apium graveolens TaxID=4045 RepID=UPI003D798448
MTSDRSWMNRRFDASKNITKEYKIGVDGFIKFSVANTDDSKGRIRCPCNECGNFYIKNPDDVILHLYRYGIMPAYTIWYFHEKSARSRVDIRTSSMNFDNTHDDFYDAREMFGDFSEANNNFENMHEEPNATAKSFYRMLDSASEPIYPNSLPEDHKFPMRYYDVKKLVSGLSMGYKKIDACLNDCMLFYKENSEKTHCDIYDEGRYKMLWFTGVETYDRVSRSNFTMKVALKWTINDFPALGMISGWSTKGKLACPVCMGMVKGKQLKHGGKPTFYGIAHYFLEEDDPLRKSTKFGRCERHSVTTRHSGSRAKMLCEQMQFPLPGKTIRQKPRDYGVTHNWTHYSPFFELPNWETLSLRHNIDVMHTEKNVFDNIFYTMLGDKKKTKDNSNARNDSKELGVHCELWIQDDGTTPDAPYVLGKEQINKLFHWIKSLNLLDGCIRGMKSHDCHIFMQKLLPIVCHDLLPKNVADVLIELSNLFQDLCLANLKYTNLEKMEKDIVKIMSKLETIYIPGFF